MKKRMAIYPGSFDPITYGHINIVERVSSIFDEVHILVMNNISKKYLFSPTERINLTRDSLSHLSNIKVVLHEGLLVDYARDNHIKSVIRGLRAVSDFEYELQMAHANKSLYKEIEIFFLMADYKNSFISSSMVKEVAEFGGNVSTWVSPNVEKALKNKFNK